MVVAELASQESDAGTQHLAPGRQHVVEHLRQLREVDALDRLERLFDRSQLLFDRRVDGRRPYHALPPTLLAPARTPFSPKRRTAFSPLLRATSSAVVPRSSATHTA